MFKMPADIITNHVMLTIHLGGRDMTTIRVERLDYIAAMNGSEVAQKIICMAARKKLNSEGTSRYGFVPWYDGLVSKVENDPDELPAPHLFDITEYQEPHARSRRKVRVRVVEDELC